MANISGFPPDRIPLPRHEILHFLRGSLECSRRDRVHRHSSVFPFVLEPRVDQTDTPLSLEQADECCNKTVPIYFHNQNPNTHGPLLLTMLHNWIYRKWFVPYKSDIEYGQYFAKTMQVRGLSTDIAPHALIQQVVALHQTICHRVQQARQAIIDFDTNQSQPYDLTDRGILAWKDVEDIIEDQQHFILQPLFQAIAIVVTGNDFSMELRDMGQLQV